jgi:predicted PurR-regulated permease PerM
MAGSGGGLKESRALLRPVLFLLVLSILLVHGTSYSRAATASQFTTTTNAIASAFAATSSANSSGGNVTALVQKLNAALNMTEQAALVNATDPSEASILLQNATSLAQQVSAEAHAVGSAGASARQTVTAESIGEVIATIAVAAVIYLYGGRLYRAFWFYLYRNYIVRRGSGGS